MYNLLLGFNSLGIAFSGMLLVNLSSTVYNLYTSTSIIAWLGGHILAFLPTLGFACLLFLTVMYKDKLEG